MNAEKKWIRGFFDPSKFGFRLKLHKEILDKMKSGDFKPVGDFYQIEVGQKKNGTGYYLAEDNWAPDPNYKSQYPRSVAKVSPPPVADGMIDDLPF